MGGIGVWVDRQAGPCMVGCMSGVRYGNVYLTFFILWLWPVFRRMILFMKKYTVFVPTVLEAVLEAASKKCMRYRT